ncbi:hypothetical protein F5B18DRAFT_585289 [Nemania serpens]|nr:hypothetical protein F5B18DRAFT_585289 [Nemania serpens]
MQCSVPALAPLLVQYLVVPAAHADVRSRHAGRALVPIPRSVVYKGPHPIPTLYRKVAGALLIQGPAPPSIPCTKGSLSNAKPGYVCRCTWGIRYTSRSDTPICAYILNLDCDGRAAGSPTYLMYFTCGQAKGSMPIWLFALPILTSPWVVSSYALRSSCTSAILVHYATGVVLS